MIVLDRAHVLITLFSFLPFMPETFVINASWTYGPFLILLAISDSQNWLRAYCVALPRFRPRTIRRCDGFFLFRVFTPSLLPHLSTTLRPPRVRPPCGWSTGFMTSPRTLGRTPSQRLLPAFPCDSSSCSALPTVPTVARQLPCTRRISVEAMRSVTYSPSFATTSSFVPAERAILPPAPGFSSTLCTSVPSGISRSGRALPTRLSEPGPETILSPTDSPLG